MPCFTYSIVLELVWVLSAGYKLSKEAVVEHVRHILCLPTISTEDVDNVLLALQWYEEGMDFTDALHLAVSLEEAEGFSTFDKGISNAVKRLDIQHKIYFLSNLARISWSEPVNSNTLSFAKNCATIDL